MDLYKHTIQTLRSESTADLLDGVADHTIIDWLLHKSVNPSYGLNGVFLDQEHQVIFNEIKNVLLAKFKLDENSLEDKEIKDFYKGITDSLDIHMQHAYQERGLL